MKLINALPLSLLPLAAFAKDPAEGWLGYATGVNPAGDNSVITFMEVRVLCVLCVAPLGLC